jgi:RNA polymerase sigma factor (TIGR02999 family)
MEDGNEITRMIEAMRTGDAEAANHVIEAVYPELRKLAAHYMRSERQDHTLQPTALVNEACLRLLGAGDVPFQNRAHFIAVAAQQMRRLLVDHARAHRARKRDGVKMQLDWAGELSISPEQDVLAIHEALEKLEFADTRAAKVVELKFFGGFTDEEAAEVLGINVAMVRRDWQFARAWLLSRLRDR